MNRPEAALPPYLFFLRNISAQNPEMNRREIRELGTQIWINMSDEERRPYQEMADRNRIRYQQEINREDIVERRLVTKPKNYEDKLLGSSRSSEE